MVRILFVSGELIGSAICHELIKEGHDVKLFIERDGWKDCLEGIIPKTTDWRNELSWVGKSGLIIFDDVCFGEAQDNLRAMGYRVVGGSALADKLETDRAHFHSVLRTYGVETLPSFDFEDSSHAIDFIRNNPDRWVVKQNTHFGALNHVGEAHCGKDAIAVLKGYKNNSMSAHLQKRVEGVEIGIARYFNGDDWVGPIEVNHEHKRMCNDDVGPLTPEMGTVMWFSEDDELPLFERTLSRLKPYLQKANFKGDFDINCIVDEENIWPLEATARFGAPSTELQSHMLVTPWLDFLLAIADGEPHQPEFKSGFGVVVSIAVPPYPYKKETVANSVFSQDFTQLIYRDDMTDDELQQVFLEEISKTNLEGEDVLYWAGTNGWTMHVAADGACIGQAKSKAYSIIEKIILPRKFYRTDIGDRVLNKDLPLLKKWGWIPMEIGQERA